MRLRATDDAMDSEAHELPEPLEPSDAVCSTRPGLDIIGGAQNHRRAKSTAVLFLGPLYASRYSSLLTRGMPGQGCIVVEMVERSI